MTDSPVAARRREIADTRRQSSSPVNTTCISSSVGEQTRGGRGGRGVARRVPGRQKVELGYEKKRIPKAFPCVRPSAQSVRLSACRCLPRRLRVAPRRVGAWPWETSPFSLIGVTSLRNCFALCSLLNVKNNIGSHLFAAMSV